MGRIDMPTRRRLLMSGGLGAVALGAGAAGFALTRTPTRAQAPWQEIETFEADPRRFVFEHAILAPNAHNMQPWSIRFIGRDQALIACEPDRRLPAADPFDRQTTIGFGCFLELASIAAAERRLRLDIELFPEGEPAERLDRRPIARTTLVQDASRPLDRLYPAIAIRRSVRAPFDMARAVPDARLEPLVREAGEGVTIGASNENSLVERVRALTVQAWEIEAATPRVFGESIGVMRIGKAEIEARPDGLALAGAGIEVMAMLGRVSREKIADPTTYAYRTGLEQQRAILAATPAYVWIATPGNGRTQQIAAGRAYARVALAAARDGLSVHPVSQALQEYPEMSGPYAAMPKALGVPEGHRLQMLARLGYGPAVEPAPRWPLDAKLARS